MPPTESTSTAAVSNSQCGTGNLAAAHAEPAVTVTATAADLISARVGATAAERKAALRGVKFDGDGDQIDAMRIGFQLTADPGLAVLG